MSHKFGFDDARAEMDKLEPALKKSRIEALRRRVDGAQLAVSRALDTEIDCIWARGF